jgi:hypothetical protein
MRAGADRFAKSWICLHRLLVRNGSQNAESYFGPLGDQISNPLLQPGGLNLGNDSGGPFED